MDELAGLQRAFVAGVRDPAAGLPPELIPLVPLPATEAFAIYRRDYAARMEEALSHRYPALHRWIGCAAFGRLTAELLADSPSRHYDIGHFGDDLPDYLTGHALAHSWPFLPELARLESAWREWLHRPAPPPADLSLLETCADPGRLYLRLIEPLRLFESAWPLLAIWQQQEAPAAPPAPQDERLVLYKNARGVRLRRLTVLEARLLRALQRGLSLAEVLQTLGDAGETGTEEDLSQAVTAFFALLRQEDWLAAVSEAAD